MIVLDASVAAKWFLPEIHAEEAQRLFLDGPGFLAPALIRIEVAGAITRRVRDDGMQEADGRLACEKWQHLLDGGLFELIPDEELFAPATDLAFKTRHTLQDCLYLAASKVSGKPLYTADRKLAERGGKILPAVLLLGSGRG
jgi:predicted nucleic acid-binding protein